MTNAGDPFLYDVAFSFLAADEPLAIRLAEPLRDRLDVFIYSDLERQTTLAGGDGEEHFARIFRVESRTVVVLYREGWGTQGFTAVEATAIRNRAYEHGYEFTTFIPLDKPRMVPTWLPRTRIWYDLDRWGYDNAAAVIESRVLAAGGQPHEETVADAAARKRREMQEVSDRNAFLESPAAVDAARRAFEELRDELRHVCEESSGLLRATDFQPNRSLTKIESVLTGATITFASDVPYSSTLAESELRVIEYLGPAKDSAYAPQWRYRFDLGPNQQPG